MVPAFSKSINPAATSASGCVSRGVVDLDAADGVAGHVRAEQADQFAASTHTRQSPDGLLPRVSRTLIADTSGRSAPAAITPTESS
jgi:hypothetical protein